MHYPWIPRPGFGWSPATTKCGVRLAFGQGPTSNVQPPPGVAGVTNNEGSAPSPYVPLPFGKLRTGRKGRGLNPDTSIRAPPCPPCLRGKNQSLSLCCSVTSVVQTKPSSGFKRQKQLFSMLIFLYEQN